jgi:hypothetical protein
MVRLCFRPNCAVASRSVSLTFPHSIGKTPGVVPYRHSHLEGVGVVHQRDPVTPSASGSESRPTVATSRLSLSPRRPSTKSRPCWTCFTCHAASFGRATERPMIDLVGPLPSSDDAVGNRDHRRCVISLRGSHARATDLTAPWECAWTGMLSGRKRTRAHGGGS